ncbi:hypothetical protein V8G54_012712 [Vigna mungo]|uniref:Integrase catalytic domain-containing protein n=1 Tax=Vigna mungo TaxID=3915 RepID=A0AAQ3NRQ7_VIGMU
MVFTIIACLLIILLVTWLYPIKRKSDVQTLFLQFKSLVENFFHRNIKILYTDNDGEYIGLRPFLSTHGISHHTTPPHTPEHNGISEAEISTLPKLVSLFSTTQVSLQVLRFQSARTIRPFESLGKNNIGFLRIIFLGNDLVRLPGSQQVFGAVAEDSSLDKNLTIWALNSTQNNFNHWWEPHSYMDQSQFEQAAKPQIRPIKKNAEIMNLEMYHVKGIEETEKNDEFLTQGVHTRFSSQRSMEERKHNQWHQQYSSPIETWEYDQQLCQQIADVTEQVKSCNEKFDKFLERCNPKNYENTSRDLETQIDEVVDKDKTEIRVEKTEEIEIERVVAEIDEEKVEIYEEEMEEEEEKMLSEEDQDEEKEKEVVERKEKNRKCVIIKKKKSKKNKKRKLREKIEKKRKRGKKKISYAKPLPHQKKYHRKENKFMSSMEIFKKLEIKVPMIETWKQVDAPTERCWKDMHLLMSARQVWVRLVTLNKRYLGGNQLLLPRFQVSPPQGQVVIAEMIIGMYDTPPAHKWMMDEFNNRVAWPEQAQESRSGAAEAPSIEEDDNEDDDDDFKDAEAGDKDDSDEDMD